MLQKSSFQTKTDLAELKQVLSWFNHFAEPILPRATLIQCQTLLAEVFTNTVRHAHSQQPPETPIELEAIITEELLEIRVWDYGPPFDLESALKHNADQADPFSTGGRGLQLICQMSDEFCYQRISATQNCCFMMKRYSDQSKS